MISLIIIYFDNTAGRISDAVIGRLKFTKAAMAKTGTEFDPIRDGELFQALLARYGSPEPTQSDTD